MKDNIKYGKAVFLKDVCLCSLSAFGGPESHMSVFLEHLVKRKKYLSEEELIELIALCSVLPGPTSTQTITTAGYKKGGAVLALLTLVVWALPILVVMGALSFSFALAEDISFIDKMLSYIGPMAVGFIITAVFTIGRKVVKDSFTAFLMTVSALLTYYFRFPWLFPLLLLAGGLAEILRVKKENRGSRMKLLNRVDVRPQWGYIAAFFLMIAVTLISRIVIEHPLAVIFESFYRYGYLVFGGGQVVIPMMINELVDVKHYLTGNEFLAGYGLVQGLPGPMFSFAAFAGGMAARGETVTVQLLGAVLGGIGIFLPGLLLIYFVYPLWQDLKKTDAVKISITGINAVAGGLLVSAAPVVFMEAGASLLNAVIAGLTFAVLKFTRIPAPVWVLITLAAGLLFQAE